MKRYKGVIFDLDGTLLDTIEDLSDSMNIVLTKYKHPNFTKEEYMLKVGNGFRGLVLNSFPEETDEKIIDKAVEQFAEIYDSNYLNKTKPYDEIDYVLDGLNRMGIKLGVNSNKKDHYTMNLVSKFFARIPFIRVYGERAGIEKKPDPTSALEIAQAMELKPEEILYIGDSKTDILTAQNADMDSVGVLWGFRSEEELREYGASYIVSSPKEILDIV
ncbi:phosphoglycolate phosphatase [Proteiniborus ethanoligenes]|uniref:Phosphoglycolate phosphatase n=1 Tax=Proteiniborus ethanoligenes TaxID=415015 RepID=A0A1H3LNM4_9FIRM|nr:HAD family hydrolase [Proteiniborus ethanoligenes]SDY65445.1 phosphoglycolate phosphatase [Proteiniborus ethanoligenes]